MKRKNKILITFLIMFLPGGILAQADDSLKINYNYINSSPQNAEIYVNNELIGNTPYFFMWGDSTFPKQVTIRMKGYADYSESFSDRRVINKTYALVPLTGSGKINVVKEDKSTYFNKRLKIVPIVISSLAIIGAGISAYYYKSLAIDNRDLYDQRGDPSALDKKRKYDIISGVSLGIFQAGLGALMYFLFLD